MFDNRDTIYQSGKLILSAKAQFQKLLCHNTCSKDTDFCNMHANYTGKQTLNFFQHVRTHTMETAVPNNRRQNQDTELA